MKYELLDHDVKTISREFRQGNYDTMKEAQRALDKATGVKTLFHLNPDFLSTHPVAKAKFTDLLDLAAEATTITIKKTLFGRIAPVDIASDGTLILPGDEPAVKMANDLDFANFGGSRLGILVVMQRREPPGYQVVVGSFSELKTIFDKWVEHMRQLNG
jgi:hypothetical protein